MAGREMQWAELKIIIGKADVAYRKIWQHFGEIQTTAIRSDDRKPTLEKEE